MNQDYSNWNRRGWADQIDFDSRVRSFSHVSSFLICIGTFIATLLFFSSGASSILALFFASVFALVAFALTRLVVVGVAYLFFN